MPNLPSPAQSACLVMPSDAKSAYLAVPRHVVPACLLRPSGMHDAPIAWPSFSSLDVRKRGRSSAFLLQEVPVRLWDGKEVILEALGELVVVAPHCIQPEEDVITWTTQGGVDQLQVSLLHVHRALRPKDIAHLQGPHQAGDLRHAWEEDEDGIGLTAGDLLR